MEESGCPFISIPVQGDGWDSWSELGRFYLLVSDFERHEEECS